MAKRRVILIPALAAGLAGSALLLAPTTPSGGPSGAQATGFHYCLGGPDVLVGRGCDCWDFDCDGDVDLKDWCIYAQGVAFGIRMGGE